MCESERNGMTSKIAVRILAQQQRQKEAEAKGEPALVRLVDVAKGDTGQSGVVGRFLLGLYNGPEYPFDLTDLRRLDADLFDDCLSVLVMDHQPMVEVHQRIEDGQAVFCQFVQWYGAK